MLVKINIRDFNPDDLYQVANLQASSFREDLNRIVKLPDEKMAEFLIKVGEVCPCPFTGYLVAENSGEIMGVMILKWPEQSIPRSKFQLSKALHYGLYTTVKLIVMKYLFPEKPKKRTCHVADLAVKPSARRKGVGTSLLNYGKEVAKKQGLTRYTLHVDADNRPAFNLYQKTGFKVVTKKKNILARWLLGIKEWYFMSQDLNTATKA